MALRAHARSSSFTSSGRSLYGTQYFCQRARRAGLTSGATDLDHSVHCSCSTSATRSTTALCPPQDFAPSATRAPPRSQATLRASFIGPPPARRPRSVPNVDERLLAQLGQVGLRLLLHLLLAELDADVVLDLGKGLGVLDLAVDELDDVEAAVGAHGARDLARLHAEDDLLDGLGQHVLAERAEIAAVAARRRIVRVLLGELREVLAPARAGARRSEEHTSELQS